MNYTIKKGSHRATPFTLGLYIDKRTITKKVNFNQNCKYIIPGEDQEDINKLFGIGYLWSHHTDSARFGWRYNPSTDKIDLFAYCYVNKERIITYLNSVNCDSEFTASIDVLSDGYIFSLKFLDSQLINSYSTRRITKTHTKQIGFPLGLYFGGNQVSPHDMNIQFISLQN